VRKSATAPLGNRKGQAALTGRESHTANRTSRAPSGIDYPTPQTRHCRVAL